jgi:hypothetical protein
MMKLVTDNYELEVSPESCVYYEDKKTGVSIYIPLTLDNKALQEIHKDDKIDLEGALQKCKKTLNDCLKLLNTLGKS